MIKVPPYATPEQRREKREKLAQIRADIIAGKRSWDECLVESDWRTQRHGSMNSFKRYQIVEPLAKAAFALSPGEYSDIIESSFGYHLLHVQSRRKGTDGFDHPKTQFQIRAFLNKQAVQQVRQKVLEKYPLVGIRPPAMPKFIREALAATTSKPAASQPATSAAQP
jgi:hypothetical protein